MKYNDKEHWEGKMYTEYELEQLGDLDSHYNNFDLDPKEND